MRAPLTPGVDVTPGGTAPERAPAVIRPGARGPSSLLSAHAVRKHCGQVARAAIEGRSAHFHWHEDRLAQVAAYVVDVIRERYPDLHVPFHSRWRHIEAGGIDRWGKLAASRGLSGLERARAAIDLVIPSVLLDAGAGPDWSYTERDTRAVYKRSEGLAIASLELYETGALDDLERITADDIARVFQASPGNPLVGLEGRAALLSRLGALMRKHPDWFGSRPRLGNLVDAWRSRSEGGGIEAADLLATLLDLLGPMWPGRIVMEGVPLGDCWPHPSASGGLVPFHKLTQWLTYSLLEPLADAGLRVTGLDALTGLPEYRNGGLLLDLGLIEAKDPTFHARLLSVDEPAVVEWRALTVVGLDRLAPLVRAALGVSESEFPLARMLEGGTWAAGRKIAAERRAGGGPPVNVRSDGTVF